VMGLEEISLYGRPQTKTVTECGRIFSTADVRQMFTFLAKMSLFGFSIVYRNASVWYSNYARVQETPKFLRNGLFEEKLKVGIFLNVYKIAISSVGRSGPF
jgi:hypothetical protein